MVRAVSLAFLVGALTSQGCTVSTTTAACPTGDIDCGTGWCCDPDHPVCLTSTNEWRCQLSMRFGGCSHPSQLRRRHLQLRRLVRLGYRLHVGMLRQRLLRPCLRLQRSRHHFNLRLVSRREPMRLISIAMFLAFCPMMLTACGTEADAESVIETPRPASKTSVEKSRLKSRVGETVPQPEIVPAHRKPIPAHKKPS